MSNKDVNGYELPWLLLTETTEEHSRSRIAVNPAHERAKYMDDSWALAMAIKDASWHLQSIAADAVAAHIRDAHKF